MERKNRSDMDWSKHELIVEDHPGIKIWRLKIPGSVLHQVNFINTENRLLVTGDYYDWLFCREFHPSADGYVSDGYWIEKLQMGKVYRTAWDYDWNYIADEIAAFPERYEGDMPEEVKDWLERLSFAIGDTVEYDYISRSERPGCVEAEDVPYSTKVPVQLEIVFDAFDEICRRMEENNELE